ncbi:response regulator transcription factor [Enterococcus faecalis]|nr:response regulator transcription factor [Enterococcus faecalis]
MKTIVLSKDKNWLKKIDKKLYKALSPVTFITRLADLRLGFSHDDFEYLFINNNDYQTYKFNNFICLLTEISKIKIFIINKKTFLMIKKENNILILRKSLLVSSDLERILLTEINNDKKLNKITKREKELLNLKALGYTQEKIANELFISRRTVDKHFQLIYEKLEVKNALSAIIVAVKIGIINL